jgi:hypothetical protein
MFDAWAGETREVEVTLYTDAFVIRGRVQTTQRRLSDILNFSASDFLVVSDAAFEALGDRTRIHRATYAQVNLSAVLFAVADTPTDSSPELRQRKKEASALVSIPPFEVAGRIHLPPEDDLRAALTELVGRFVPVTDARFWSDALGEPQQRAQMVAVNHARAQILSPYDVDAPDKAWADLDERGTPATDSTDEPTTAPAGSIEGTGA